MSDHVETLKKVMARGAYWDCKEGIPDYDTKIPAAIRGLLEEREKLSKALAAVEDVNERQRAEVERVKDWLKYAANSKGGLVAEIDEALRGEK